MPSPVHYLLQQTSANSGLVGLMNSAEFILPLNDSGSGVVSLSLGRGAGAATFTRATTATTVLSSGLIGSVASGSARSYYDPTSLAYLGYLAEGSRVNIGLQSEDWSNATWTKGATTVSANAIASPDGAVTADKLAEDNTSAAHRAVQTITLTASTVYSITVFAKAAERNWLQLYALCTDGNNRGVNFDLTTGTVGTPWGGGTVSGAIKAYPNGWYRCEVRLDTGAGATGTTASTGIATSDSVGLASYLGVTGSGLYLWGYQVEQAAFASSYIPTTTVAVTRNADSFSFTFAGNAGDTAGAVYAEVSTVWAGTAAAIMQIWGGVNNNGLLISSGAADTTIAVNDGTTETQKTGLTSLATAVRKRAMSYGGVLMSVTGDGAAVATSAFDGGMKGGAASLFIGSNGSVSNNFYGTIKNVRIWLRQLPDATLQTITA